MDPKMLMMLPNVQPEEMMNIQELTRDMSENQKQQFMLFYSNKRKEEQGLMILALIGFFGFAGIHRLTTGDTALGIIYLLTFGLCGVGTIIDLVNIKKITAEYNRKQAIEAARMAAIM
jgi:TM2 domain-containing membrane protein YozV